MDDRIKIRVYYSPKRNEYSAYVRVEGYPYAAVHAASREAAVAEANRYAAQIEFDEEGNW